MTEKSIETELLQRIADELTQKEVELVFGGDEELKEANSEFRGKDGTTDVLSFPLEDVPFAPLGTVLLNLEMAERVAKELGHPFEQEVAILFLHGILHLLGYDHECDNGEQEREERRLQEHFDLPINLINRND